ncbi:hypothetical protein NMG60_11030939 [Bertholletia excelsa]
MKMRNKGKIHPSPSSSSSEDRDAPFSVLKLLPAAILALISLLSLEDREVLAYMITRSMKSANPSSIIEEKKKNSKNPNTHKPPIFDCECFDCYRRYWFRWDSSPNRELIHQAIEAFEEHLASEEQVRKNNSRGKKREKLPKMTRRAAEKHGNDVGSNEYVLALPENGATRAGSAQNVLGLEENDASAVRSPEKVLSMPESDAGPVSPAENTDGTADESPEKAEEAALALRGFPAASNHKGLARKFLPDVVGLLNSRLWSLWSPNV